MSEPLHQIKTLPLREQMHDRYRMAFFPLTFAFVTLVVCVLHQWVAVQVAAGALIGAGIGMVPSWRHGTPAIMRIAGASGQAQTDAWLAARRHVRDARGWVPRLPRALYFDSQIVRYQHHSVIGPVLVLRKLRRLLQSSSRLQG